VSPNNSNVLDRDRFRANLLSYTRKAYRMLPELVEPRILDIGCGSGVSTLELARLSGGDIVAVDIDKEALGKLVNKAEIEGLSSRVTVVHSSMLEMDFPSNSFDIIWSEGAISYIGFERGLREWRNFLIPDGYLVVHDAMSDLRKKIEFTSACGYTMLGQIELSPDIWWKEYYEPLQRQIKKLRGTSPSDKIMVNEIEAANREIEEFDPKCDRFGSVFFILKKV
jgi:SAM-dependent methyltransferase